MAHALETDPFSQLEENLQCDVCLGELKDPRTLPCFHSFCKDCLEGVVKTCRDKAPRGRPIREFPCPNCRQTFTLDPEKQVADMRRNHFICNMVKAVAILDRGIGVPCSHNCSQSCSVARCVTCEKFLCRECLTDHNKYRANTGHSVLTIEELSKPENRKKIKDKMYCNEHQGEVLKVYCETCDQLICKDCMDFKHVKPNHSCFLVKYVANNYKKLLASNNKTMEDTLTENNTFLEELSRMTERLNRDAENIKSKIIQRKEFMAKKVVEMLDEKAETLLNKVEAMHKEAREDLNRQTGAERKVYVENVQRSVQLSKRLVDQGTEEEIISSQKMMLDNANNLLTKRQEHFKAPIPVAMLSYTPCASEEPLNKEVVRGLANSLGEVNRGSKDKGPSAIGDTLKIGGTEMSVEQWNTKTTQAEAPRSESVSKIWSTDGSTVPDNDYQIFAYNDESMADRKDNRGQTGKKSFGKETCHNKFGDRRPGLNSDQATTPPFSQALFSEAKVKLSDDFTEQVKKQKKFKEILKEENVELHKGYLTGTWSAIYAAGQKLVSFICGSDQTGNKNDPATNFSFASSIAGDEPMDTSPTPSDQSAQSKQSDESFTVNTFFLRHIMAYNYEVFQKLEKVSKEISIEVKSKTERDLKLIARKDVDQKKFSKRVDKFIDFYQAQNQKMHKEEIPMAPKDKKDVISEARTKFSVVIDSAQEKDKITIYGERDKVQEALKFLKSKDGDLTAKPNKAADSSPKTKSATKEKVLIEKLFCALVQNVKVSVYQGDITKETADVIVNPADEDLKHSAGAAAAIVKAGGRSIQDESEDIMKKRRYRSLTPGEVLATKAGNLPCNLIIHAVGPRWANYNQKDKAKNVLYNAVFNCLTVASQNGATSISIPAISSGIFGVPVPICAEVLFAAATNFAKDALKSNPLKDIRFVNIDKPTSQVFAQEMKKRFGAAIQRENVEVFHSNNAGRNANQYEQSQSNTSVTRVGSRDLRRPGGDDKGGQGGKSNLNPKATVFSTSGSHSSSAPASYSNAVTGNTAKGKDNKPRAGPKGTDKEECSICLCDMTDKKTLDKCGHSFCARCIDKAFKHQKKCPICYQVYGLLIGNQPPGKMIDSFQATSLPGFGDCGTIVISYRFPNGSQGPDHPNPGKPYAGTNRTVYLPDNAEGRKVQKLLRKSFDQKLTFTIGRSITTGKDNCIIWNGMHHKTSKTGGPTDFGYPDPDYLKEVQDDLAAKGITE